MTLSDKGDEFEAQFLLVHRSRGKSHLSCQHGESGIRLPRFVMHGHIMLYDEEKGFHLEYIYDYYFQCLEAVDDNVEAEKDVERRPTRSMLGYCAETLIWPPNVELKSYYGSGCPQYLASV
jgi:hypothetical protein